MKVALIATFCIVGIVAIFPLNLFAKNLGVYGSIYSISEPDMLTAISRKLILMKKDGELARQKKEFIARSIAHILRPKPVSGVSDLGNKKPSKHLFNPSVILNRNITNTTGQVVAFAGTKINPLKIESFDEALLFIDGDSEKQIHWALKIDRKDAPYYSDIKIILVNGNINQSAKALKQRVYFDQAGVLCKKFGIKHTPTMVYQQIVHGKRIPRLMVEEFHA